MSRVQNEKWAAQRAQGRLLIKSNDPRAIYNHLRGMFGQRNIVSEGYLRLEQNGVAQNTIEFAVRQDEGTPSKTERRLSQADDFVVTHLGMALIASTTEDKTANEFGHRTLISYDSAAGFAGASDPVYSRMVYNGRLSLRKNSIVVFDALDLIKFKYANQAQIGITGISSNAWNREVPFAPITPGLILSGDAKNLIEMTVPVSASQNLSDIQLRIAVLARGFLIQGATN